MIGLAAPENKNKIVTENGYNNDIITVLNDQFSKAVDQTKNVHFSGKTLAEKGRAIFNFLKNTITYKKDPEGKQLIQLPARMIADTKLADCKSLGLASAAFMFNNGFKNVRLRYASYDKTDNTPTHVYAVGEDLSGNEIIIDPVYRAYNKEAAYKSKIDYKMQISVLSGLSRLPAATVKENYYDDLLHKVRAGGLLYTVILNQKHRKEGTAANTIRYNTHDLEKYVKFLLRKRNETTAPKVKALLDEEIRVARSGNFTGSIYLPHNRNTAIKGLEEEIGKLNLKKLGKGIKKGLKKIDPRNLLKGVKTLAFAVPRKAFLSIVFFNVRGIAKKLNKLPDSELRSFWVQKFGGSLSSLKKAIAKGMKKKALFGASKKVKAIKGIGLVVDDSIGAGEAASSAGGDAGSGGISISSIMAVAAPLLAIIAKLFEKHNVKDDPEDQQAAQATGENTSFVDAITSATSSIPEISKYVNSAVDVAEKTGIIPERPLSIQEEAVSKTFESHSNNEDDITEDKPSSTFELPSPVLLAGAVLGAYLLLKPKRATKS